MATPKRYEGIYDFTHPGGTFDVQLRPEGNFFAPQFQARATWDLTEDNHLIIDWKRFGKYQLSLVESELMMNGLNCGNCGNALKKALMEVEGIAEVTAETKSDTGSHPNKVVVKGTASKEAVRVAIAKLDAGRGKFTLADCTPEFEGSAVGDPANWRKMKRRELFSAAEAKLFDSVWEFQHPGTWMTRVLECRRRAVRVPDLRPGPRTAAPP